MTAIGRQAYCLETGSFSRHRWQKSGREQVRKQIVLAVRRGSSMRAAARRFNVCLRTVQRWVARAAGQQRLGRVDFSSRPAGCRRAAGRTSRPMEDRVLSLRVHLRDHDPLGEYDAVAIQRALLEDEPGAAVVPSVRTINRILLRHGVFDGGKRRRFNPPPRGWHLPRLAAGRAELDSFDIVEGLVIAGEPGEVNVLNGISLHGGLCASWPLRSITSKITAQKLTEHWRQVGLPDYVQFDNGSVFQGAHQWPDSFGRVTRLCLSLGVVPVFAPPRETGFQAAIENYNGRWQRKVWQRFHHRCLGELLVRSDAFIAAARYRAAVRIESAPPRRPFPDSWTLDLRQPLAGTVLFIRRTDDQGRAHLLGRSFPVNQHWTHRLIRAEVDLTAGRIRFHALRRREPDQQPILHETDYQTPTTPFRG